MTNHDILALYQVQTVTVCVIVCVTVFVPGSTKNLSCTTDWWEVSNEMRPNYHKHTSKRQARIRDESLGLALMAHGPDMMQPAHFARNLPARAPTTPLLNSPVF